MKEELKRLVGDSLTLENVFIDDVYLEKEGNDNYLRVVVDTKDKNDIIDIERKNSMSMMLKKIINKKKHHFNLEWCFLL